jgi:hypothetical protein
MPYTLSLAHRLQAANGSRLFGDAWTAIGFINVPSGAVGAAYNLAGLLARHISLPSKIRHRLPDAA